MPLALANIAFNLREGGDNEVPVHTHNNPSVEAGDPQQTRVAGSGDETEAVALYPLV